MSWFAGICYDYVWVVVDRLDKIFKLACECGLERKVLRMRWKHLFYCVWNECFLFFSFLVRVHGIGDAYVRIGRMFYVENRTTEH